MQPLKFENVCCPVSPELLFWFTALSQVQICAMKQGTRPKLIGGAKPRRTNRTRQSKHQCNHFLSGVVSRLMFSVDFYKLSRELKDPWMYLTIFYQASSEEAICKFISINDVQFSQTVYIHRKFVSQTLTPLRFLFKLIAKLTKIMSLKSHMLYALKYNSYQEILSNSLVLFF